MNGVARWRPAFVFSALLLMVAGPQHPDGTMLEMLALILSGLWGIRRAAERPAGGAQILP